MRSWIIILLFVAFTESVSQELPRIIHPSPETSALFKFQDFPVSHSTGVPEITVPILQISTGAFDIPISISYHASGRSVYDQDGPIASGWTLNAGGMVSRTIHGSEDFGKHKFPYPFETRDLHPKNDIEYFQNIAHYHQSTTPGLFADSEYDVFSYSMNGLSGKFIFKDDNNVKTAALIPYKPYTIEPIRSEDGISGLHGLKILDDKGISYQFVGMEIQSIFGQNAFTGYGLVEMISSNKADTVKFSYDFFTLRKTSISQAWTVFDKASEVGEKIGFSESPVDSEIKAETSYQIARLKEISFRTGKIVFNLRGASDKVESIALFNADGELIKTVQFSIIPLTALSDGNLPLHNLDRITNLDKKGGEVDRYSFEYFPFKYPFGKTAMDVRFRDYWGYYNASGTRQIVPHNIVRFFDYSQSYDIGVGDATANRKPNIEGLKSGMLRKITFPTGGTVEFDFEHNKYKSILNGGVYAGPGMRVTEIVTSDGNGNLMFRSFKYGINENGFSFIDLEPSVQSMSVEQYNVYMTCATTMDFSPGGCYYYRVRTFSSDFNDIVQPISARPIIYREVTEYQGRQKTNSGKIVYKFDYSPWYSGSMAMGSMHIPFYNYWDTPSLMFKDSYEVVSSSAGGLVYNLINQVQNIYQPITLETVTGLHINRLWNFPQSGLHPIDNGDFRSCPAETFAVLNYYPYHPQLFSNGYPYGYQEYAVPIGVKHLKTSIERNFHDDGSMTSKVVDYSYNSKQLLSKISFLGSDNQLIEKETKYPFDDLQNPIHEAMASRQVNLVNFPIETIEKKGGHLVKRLRNNYDIWNSSSFHIYPKTVDTQFGGESPQTVVRYNSYDLFGNPTEVLKENDFVFTYIWNYRNSLPVARVSNAVISDVAYTSFEGDMNGNWTGISSTSIVKNPAAFTGQSYYRLSGSILSKAGLNASKSYSVTYWSSGGAVSVSGTAPPGYPKKLQAKTIGGVEWSLWEHRVSGIETITITGTVQIDELRLFPSNAQMETFCFMPLVGIISSCDVNNYVMRYKYDDAGRLEQVLDSDGNLLKTVQYRIQSTSP